MQLFSLIICFAKFTNPIRDVTDIRRISALRIAGSRGCSVLDIRLEVELLFYGHLLLLTPVQQLRVIWRIQQQEKKELKYRLELNSRTKRAQGTGGVPE